MVGIAEDDIWLNAKIALSVTSGGVVVGLLTLYTFSRLIPRSIYLSHSAWKAICACYFSYAASGVAAAAFGLLLRLVIPGGLQALPWFQNSVIIVLIALVWALLGIIVNRLQVREEALQKAYAELERRVDERTTELSQSKALLEREIVEHKKAGEALRQLHMEEKELRQQVEREMYRRSEFTRGLVHELKTPLTPIVASSELLADELQEKHLRSLARNINQSASYLSKRIDELLDLAKGEIGILDLNYSLVDPLQLLHEVAEDMAPVVSNRKQSLVLDLPRSICQVSADKVRLRQVVLNLLDNACKFTPEGGKITLRGMETEASLIVEVEDTGCGISKEMRQRLFDPYQRLESDRERRSGLGLGLALCKILVDLHGGQIWEKSQKDQGSTFSFSIPLKA